MIYFGGRDGEDLPYLTRITTWTVDSLLVTCVPRTTHIHAIEFSYSYPNGDQRSLSIGVIPDMEWEHPRPAMKHFDINSSQGERIISLTVHYKRPFEVNRFIVSILDGANPYRYLTAFDLH